MGLFHESLETFDDLFTHQLEDVYDAVWTNVGDALGHAV